MANVSIKAVRALIPYRSLGTIEYGVFDQSYAGRSAIRWDRVLAVHEIRANTLSYVPDDIRPRAKAILVIENGTHSPTNHLIEDTLDDICQYFAPMTKG